MGTDEGGAAAATSTAETGAAAQPILEECDLVMKGGITSGVVYPPAVMVLKSRYRFRRIGGTSAGAIAAALTAAAEFARARGGFDRLRRVSDELSEPGFISNLFQPSPAARPAMEMARHLLFEFRQDRRLRELRGWRLGWYVVRQLGAKMRRNLPQAYGRGWWFGLGTGFLLTALLHAFVALIALRLVGQAEHRRAVFATLAGAALIGAALIGVSLGALGGFVTGAMRLWQIFSVEVPQNFFGLCNGSRDEPPDRNASSAPVLTDWLSEQIDRVARGDEQWADAAPLTFRELAEQGIVLQMVTTNLSHHQPYRVPFRDNIFLFNEADLDRLFPPRVVHYMKEAAYQSARRSGRVIPPPGFHFLPEGDKLPVAVGMRLSLSFPILLSMVRLYTINTRAFLRRRRGQDLQLTPDDLQPNWFSDGGISSNFPIHFFDRWLPDHPTFGINLTQLPAEAFKGGAAAAGPAGPPGAPQAPADEPDQPVEQEYFTMGAEIGAADDEADGAGAEEVADQQVARELNDVSAAVFLHGPSDVPTPTWKPISNLVSFAGAVWSTAQNYHDNTQSMLPSYRERIVQICFARSEGGLNLAMEPRTIERIKRKGRAAGELLCSQFDFDRHRWVRLLVLLAQLEVRLSEMRSAVPSVNEYVALLEKQRTADPKFPYSRPASPWCEEALARLRQLTDLIDRWHEADEVWQRQHPGKPLFPYRSPAPPPVLRITPEL